MKEFIYVIDDKEQEIKLYKLNFKDIKNLKKVDIVIPDKVWYEKELENKKKLEKHLELLKKQKGLKQINIDDIVVLQEDENGGFYICKVILNKTDNERYLLHSEQGLISKEDLDLLDEKDIEDLIRFNKEKEWNSHEAFEMDLYRIAEMRGSVGVEIRKLIKSELEAINEYETMKKTCRPDLRFIGDDEKLIIAAIDEIIADERNHVGLLESLLGLINKKEEEEILAGKEELEEVKEELKKSV